MARKKSTVIEPRDIMEAVKMVEDAKSPKSSRTNRGKNFKDIEPYKWKPGQSGNPAGRPKSTVAMKQGFAALTDRALRIADLRSRLAEMRLQRAHDMVMDPNASADQIAEGLAIADSVGLETMREILDRGHGKAQQNVAVTAGDILEGMTREELEAFILSAGPEVLALISARRKSQG